MERTFFLPIKDLFGKMQEIVDKEMTDYKSDLKHDMDILKAADDRQEGANFAWFVRDMGTNLVNLSLGERTQYRLDAVEQSWSDVVKRFNILFVPTIGWTISAR